MIQLIVPRFDPHNPRSAVENMKLLAGKGEALYMAFLHDDVEFPSTCDDVWWKVVEFFDIHPKCGMIGFGGALGLGASEIYKRPYQLIQLARIDYISNMDEAELHGRRVTVPTQVSVLDGFCQIIRRTAYEDVGGWQTVLDMGITFHCYDLAMACLMKRHGWEVWMLPIAVHHRGGVTSTSAKYDAWLRSLGVDGDAEIHARAHRICYDAFRDVLPLRL